jgi:hypothetical protein
MPKTRIISDRIILLVFGVAALFLVANWIGRLREPPPKNEKIILDQLDERTELLHQISELKSRRTEALKDKNTPEVITIDKQLDVLSLKEASLAAKEKERQEAARRYAQWEQEVAQKRKLEEEQRELDKKLQREAEELKRKCDAVKEKRLSDPTTNDVELLKTCGAPAPYLPVR